MMIVVVLIDMMIAEVLIVMMTAEVDQTDTTIEEEVVLLQEEWEGMGGDSAGSASIPILPKDVGILFSPRSDVTKHIIVKSDDRKGLIIIEGFLNPGGPPVLVKQWSFKPPKIS